MKEVRVVKRFDGLLEENVSGYNGKLSEIIREAPAFYRLMVQLLDDPHLPKHLSQPVIAAIAYFILPADAIPEDKFGPIGYIDDIFLCAFVADRVMKEAGSEDILSSNWDGKMPIVPLVKEILDREKELIGDKKALIMKYIEEE
jgi:uncharacterized membrane protein YkvA (DUF1232 family)